MRGQRNFDGQREWMEGIVWAKEWSYPTINPSNQKVLIFQIIMVISEANHKKYLISFFLPDASKINRIFIIDRRTNDKSKTEIPSNGVDEFNRSKRNILHPKRSLKPANFPGNQKTDRNSKTIRRTGSKERLFEKKPLTFLSGYPSHIPLRSVGGVCRIYRGHLCSGVRRPPMCVLDVILNKLMVRL